MFKISTKASSKTAVVTVLRSLDFPETPPLPALQLKTQSRVTLNLGGIDPKSEIAKDIISQFENVFGFELKRFGTKADNSHIATWKKAAQAILANKDQSKIETFARTFEKGVLDDWNTFNTKTAKRYAETSLASVTESVLKKHKAKAAQPKMAFSSEDLKADRVGILTSIMAAVAVTVGTMGAGSVVAAIAAGIITIKSMLKGYNSAWKLNQKRLGDAQGNLADIKRALEDGKSALDKLAPSLARLEQHKKEIQASIAKCANELRKTKAELDRLETLATTDKRVKEGKYIGDVAKRAEKLGLKLDTLRIALGKTNELATKISVAQTAVDSAVTGIALERNRWDQIMDAYNKLDSDTDTVMGAVAQITKLFK